MPVTCLIAALILFQYPAGTVPRRQSSPIVNTPANTDAVATFTGTFKSADKKYVFIDVEGGNTMRLYVTGSTKFIRDDKAAKAADFHSGDPVTVDAERDNRLNLIAVRVASAPPSTDKKPAAPEQ